MNENEYISSLKARDIRPTALRVLILRTMAGFDRAFSLADLEEELDTVDKSTLFRTLTLFLAHHLVHGIDDGTGSLKYALCSSDCDCEIDDLHTHFYCTHCRRTFCLRGVAVPQVDKSTLFRTLTLFLAHHLVHGIDDGTGSLKYALCSSDCDCEIDDLHTHFYCTHCRRTFCLRGVAVPQVGLPDGFSAETINFVIKGICADCSGRN